MKSGEAMSSVARVDVGLAADMLRSARRVLAMIKPLPGVDAEDVIGEAMLRWWSWRQRQQASRDIEAPESSKVLAGIIRNVMFEQVRTLRRRWRQVSPIDRATVARHVHEFTLKWLEAETLLRRFLLRRLSEVDVRMFLLVRWHGDPWHVAGRRVGLHEDRDWQAAQRRILRKVSAPGFRESYEAWLAAMEIGRPSTNNPQTTENQ